MKKMMFFGLLLGFTFQIAVAQTVKTTGSVKNDKGVPLSYVFVQDKQSKAATYTDSLGNFSLSSDPNSILVISSKGYKNAEVKIENKTNLQVVLQHGPSGDNSDNSQTSGAVDVTLNDAFSGHTYTNSAINSGNATQGGEAKFNGASFPVTKEKEETHGSRFLFADWLGGYVINTKDEQIKNPDFLFKYDKIRGSLLLTHDQISAIDVDKDQVKSFTLYDKANQPLVFERVPAVDNVHFMEVLAAGAKYKIYKLTTAKFIKSDMETNGLVSTGNPYDEYVNEDTYYVLTIKNNQAQKLSLKKKSIKQVFGDEGNKLDNFLSQHNGDTYDDNFLKSLGNSMNQ